MIRLGSIVAGELGVFPVLRVQLEVESDDDYDDNDENADLQGDMIMCQDRLWYTLDNEMSHESIIREYLRLTRLEILLNLELALASYAIPRFLNLRKTLGRLLC